MNADHFFKNATLQLFSSQKIEIAAHNCRLCIDPFIPADFLSIHLFDPGLGFIETVADARPEGSFPVAHKTILPAEVRRFIAAHIKSYTGMAKIRIIDRLSDDAMTRQVGLELGTPDDPCLTMDLAMDDVFLGVVALTNTRGILYTDEHARLLLSLHEPFALYLANFWRLREIQQLKDLLDDDNRFLKNEMMREAGVEVIGADFGLKSVMDLVRRVAPLDSPVLLLGETGAGKEVVARAIHLSSSRNNGPFIKVNCGGIPPSLIDSELFGHEKGAFTGAAERRRGYFERAHGGTLLLDEIGELPLECQTRLLHVLQESMIERVGGKEPFSVDIRILAATHRNLEGMVQEGAFRQDLWFRLNVFPISIPPLRERKTDIPDLVQHFIRKKAREMKLRDFPKVASGAIDPLMAYDWPGNIRELQNVVERELIISQGQELTFAHSVGLVQPPPLPPIPNEKEDFSPRPLDEMIAEYLTRVLNHTNGKISGEKGAAQLLGVHPRTLMHRMNKLGIPHGRKAKKLYA